MAYSIYDHFVANSTGDIVNNATVTVNNAGGSLAQIYVNRLGTPTIDYPSGQLPNPLTVTNGRITFYAPAVGRYTITAVTADGTVVFSDVLLPAENPATLEDIAALTIENFAALASTPAVAGKIVQTQYYGPDSTRGGNLYKAYNGAPTLAGVESVSATVGVFWSLVRHGDLNVDDVGATPDGVTDNYTAIVNAIAATKGNAAGIGGVRLQFSSGIYCIGTTLPVQSVPIKFCGVGNGDPGSPHVLTDGTKIKYTGGFTSDWILPFYQMWYGGGGVSGITFLCENNCRGVLVDSSSGLRFDDMHVREDNYIGLDVTSSSTTTCSWNTFTNILVDDFYASSGIAGIRCHGGPGLGNACHNVFINTKINHNLTRQGLILGYCDNNTFYMSYIFKVGGSGYGVYGDSTLGGGFPGNNTFYHLQAMGGYYQDATSTTPSAVIYGYQKDNGEPDPVNAGSAAATIFWITDNARINGVKSIVYRPNSDGQDKGNSVITIGNTFVDVAVSSPNGNFMVMIQPSNNPGSFWWVTNRTTSGFRVNLSVAAGGSWNFEWYISRTA